MGNNFITKQYELTWSEYSDFIDSLLRDADAKEISHGINLTYLWKSVSILVVPRKIAIENPDIECIIKVHNDYALDLETFLNQEKYSFLKRKE